MASHDSAQPPKDVLDAWSISNATITPITVGLINRSYLATRGTERFVLQRLHPSFSAAVHLDIEAITKHLENKGVGTTRLLPTQSGALWQEAHDGIWRLLRHVEGLVHSEVRDQQVAHAAGRAVADFHHALLDLKHTFHNVRPGVHDTLLYLNKLQILLRAHRLDPEMEPFVALSKAILMHGKQLPLEPPLPQRLIHGDLKITNLIFDPACPEVRAIIDLDTLARGTLDAEMGDAFRSWCNPKGESNVAAEIDVQLFAAAVTGYAQGSRDWITDSEVHALRPGTERIALELASRFCIDGFEDSYFGWDASRFASRREHNLVRTQSQLSLAASIRENRDALDREVARAFRVH